MALIATAARCARTRTPSCTAAWRTGRSTSSATPSTATYRTEIGNGTEQEDVPATRSLGHFYNPETNSAPWFALGSGPATQNSQDQYDAALSAYGNNNLVGTDAAFHRLGRALHFIEDMTSPAHTHDDDHATGDDFEGWGPDNFPSMNFSTRHAEVRQPGDAGGLRHGAGAADLRPDRLSDGALRDRRRRSRTASFKQMFPSLHFETGGFFTDDHFEIDRIGDWGCDLLCADDWWIPDELLTTDNGGPGGVVRHTGSAYIENTGGDGGPVVPVVFDGQPNAANENLLQIYGRLLYPEAIAYGAGLLQVFAGDVGVRRRRRPRPAPPPTVTDLHADADRVDPDAARQRPPLRHRDAHATPTSTPSRPRPPRARHRDGDTDVTVTPTASATGSASGTPTDTPTATPTPTSTPTSASRPRARAAARRRAGQALFQFRGSASAPRPSGAGHDGDATLSQFGRPEQTAEYALCVYDNAGGAATLAMDAHIPPAGTCGGSPCWKPNARGFRYKSHGTNADGIDSVILKEGVGGRAKIIVKMKGAGVTLPAPFSGARQFEQNPAVRVQLVNSVGACWEASFLPPAFRNEAGSFKDKSD